MKIIFMLVLILSSLSSHPHTFMDVYPVIVAKDGKSNGLEITWKIDEMTSSMLIMDVDMDGDGKLNANESNYIKNNYFTIFANYNFYTYIIIKGKKVTLPEPTEFKAKIENHRVCYTFKLKIEFDIEDTVFEFGDTDMYTAMVLKPKFVTVNGAKAVVKGVDNDFYYGYRLELK